MPVNTEVKDGAPPARDPAVRPAVQQMGRPQPAAATAPAAAGAAEFGGRKDGTEPTRFGDWEKQGRCIDF